MCVEDLCLCDGQVLPQRGASDVLMVNAKIIRNRFLELQRQGCGGPGEHDAEESRVFVFTS